MGVQMWFIVPLEVSAYACVLSARFSFCARLCVLVRLQVNMLHKNTIHRPVYVSVCVWMQEAMGCASLSVTALLFLFSNWRRQRTRHTAVTAG